MEIAKKVEIARDSLKELAELYESHSIQLDENDNKTQDILHQIELGSYNEGRKWYGILRKVRKDRRINKDILEVLDRFHNLMNSELGIKFMRQLDEALGDARNKEKKMQNRHYAAKYIQNLPISNKELVD